jgi:DNA mismatch repair protein MutS2
MKTKKSNKNSTPATRIPQIDLHGLNSEQAEEAILDFLNDAVLKGHKKLKIIHGLGSGKLKALTPQILANSGVTKRFEQSPDNPGVTNVYL